MRIAIIDDHPVVREGLVAALTSEEIEVAGAFGSVGEAAVALSRLDCDVVVLDLELPDGSGAEAVRAIAQASSAPILVLTAYDADEQLLGALDAGARGYLLKGASVNEIRRAIAAVSRGESVLDPRVAGKVIALTRRDRPAQLSDREREVLGRIARGQSNKEIAAALSISERTAKFHVTSIFNKLGVGNRAAAVAVAKERGLV
jgi:DNA-binding NarL/FixJ family response regulator